MLRRRDATAANRTPAAAPRPGAGAPPPAAMAGVAGNQARQQSQSSVDFDVGALSHGGVAGNGGVDLLVGGAVVLLEQGHGRQQRNELNPFHYHTLLSLPSRTERKNRRMIAENTENSEINLRIKSQQQWNRSI